MKTITMYLDDLKEKTGSDYKTAKLLNTGTNTISMIRKRNQCADETAIKIADLLGIDQGELLIAAAIARSSNEDVKHAWEKASKRMGIAAGIAMASALTLGNSSADMNLTESIQSPSMYIMLNYNIYCSAIPK
jgi:hypothetical protein